MFYSKKRIENILSFDIEVVAKVSSLDKLSKEEREIWLFRYHEKFYKKALEEKQRYILSGKKWLINEESPNDIFVKYAPLVAEFAKVIAISFGKATFDKKGEVTAEFDNIVMDDEKQLLTNTAKVFEGLSHFEPGGFNICSYDIPMLIKRMVINGIKIPEVINFIGKKPWEMKVLDIAMDWKAGGFEMAAFETLLAALQIPSSKHGAVNGMELSYMYYNGLCTLEDIENYVQDDNDKNIQVLVKLTN